MDDKKQIAALYEQMYKAMITKDMVALDSLHASEFVLTHMTGMKQTKAQYLEAIRTGMLNYYSAVTDHLDIQVADNHAVMSGYSQVAAAVFGGDRHTWHLLLCFTLAKRNSRWYFIRANASTY